MADPITFAITVAATAANMALTMSRKIEGPRVQDLKFTGGDYGALLARFWGARRLQLSVFWGEDLKEVKQRRKTKGGKYNDYTYYGSWATAGACHEIASFSKIWFDTQLAFDLTGAGPISPLFSLNTSGDAAVLRTLLTAKGIGGTIFDKVGIYLGTMTQEPDPRIQATTEAKNGAGSCPAYLGTPYLAFKDIPLDKVGNRIPQTTVEELSVVATTILSEHYTTTIGTNFNSATFSPDFARFAWVNGDQYEIWDTAARAPMIVGTLPFTASPDRIGIFDNGNMLVVDTDAGGDVWVVTPDGGVTDVQVTTPNQQAGVMVVGDGDGGEHFGTRPWSAITGFYFDGTLFDYGWQAAFYWADVYGDVWVVGTSGTTAHFLRLYWTSDSPYLPEFTLAMPGTSGSATCATATATHFILYWDGVLYVVDPLTATATSSAIIPPLATFRPDVAFANRVPGSSTLWLLDSEYNLDTGALVRSVTLPPDPGTRVTVYDPISHALWTNDNDLTIYFIDRVSNPGVTLRQIVEDVCELAGIDLATIDASALTQTITGYSVAGGTGKDWLEPLLDLYDIDARPHGFKLEFVPRGSAPLATIVSDDFALPASAGPLFVQTAGGGTDLPAQVTLQFADVGTGQVQPNTAMSPPLFDAQSQRVLSLDMSTLALTADEARQLVARYARRQRFDAKTVALALTARSIALEPADVETLDLRGVPVGARLQSLVLGADRRIETEWRRDDASIHALDGASGAEADGHTAPTIVVPLISKGFELDIPLLRDADNAANPVLYVAAAPYTTGTWPGATLFQAVDGEYSLEQTSVASAAMATWGKTAGVLGDANPNLWDRINTVDVLLQVGSLAGCTEADIDVAPGRNQLLIGGEVVNFASATLIAPKTWRVGTFKRGRRGTEAATASHISGEVVLLLDNAQPVQLGLSEVGTNLSFKPVTAGLLAGGAFPIAVAPFTGASLKPYAACHLQAVRDLGTGDWALSWVRRTRVGGAWTGGTPIPLSEASELYVVEILNGSTVVRTITGLTSPAATWTAAQQTTDFGSGQSTVHFRVYQISDAVGRGFPAEATV